MSARRQVRTRRWRAAGALALLAALAAGCGTTVAGRPTAVGSDLPGTGPTTIPATATGSGQLAEPGSATGSAVSTPAPRMPVPATSGGSAGLDTSTATAPLTTPAGTTPTAGGAPPATGSDGSTVAPPSWVTAGLRITYYLSGATTTATTTWVKDPNGPWVDPATGQHYSQRTTQSGTGDSDNSAGDGFSQYDILDSSSSGVVYVDNLYTIDHLNGTLEPTTSTGARQTGGNLTGVWFTPAFLQRELASPTPPFIALEGPYTVGTTTYQAITLMDPDPTDSRSSTYDSKTGLMLAESSTVQTTGATGGTVDQLGNSRLAEVRQVPLPGAGGTNPSWVGSSGTLSYSGTYRLANPADPQLVQTSAITVSARYSTLQGQAMSVTNTSTVQGRSPTQTTTVTGPSGEYWIDPSALAALKQGQVLDTDPVTHNQLSVSSAGAGEVTLSSAMPGISTTDVYDLSSGALRSVQSQSVDTGVTVTLQRQGQ